MRGAEDDGNVATVTALLPTLRSYRSRVIGLIETVALVCKSEIKMSLFVGFKQYKLIVETG
jgi:hypothetical protein